MRTTFLCLAVMFIVPQVDAAPAPVPGLKAKEKLEVLKKRLPAVLEAWAKESQIGYPFIYIPVLRRVRAIGNAEAKVVIFLHYRDDQGEVKDKVDYILTVYITYYEGLWTAIRVQGSHPEGNRSWTHATQMLMDAIDEAAEK